VVVKRKMKTNCESILADLENLKVFKKQNVEE